MAKTRQQLRVTALGQRLDAAVVKIEGLEAINLSLLEQVNRLQADVDWLKKEIYPLLLGRATP